MRNALVIEILNGLNSVPENQRNSRLYAEAEKLARFGWSQKRAKTVLLETAMRCKPPIHEATVYLIFERVWGAGRSPRRYLSQAPVKQRCTFRDWFELLWEAHQPTIRPLSGCERLDKASLGKESLSMLESRHLEHCLRQSDRRLLRAESRRAFRGLASCLIRGFPDAFSAIRIFIVSLLLTLITV
jgi:hypothetical protein